MKNYYRIVCILLAAIGFLMLGYGDVHNQEHKRWVRILGVLFTVFSSGGLFVINVLKPGRHKEDIL